MKKILREYRVEVAAAILAAFGLLLLLQRHRVEPWLTNVFAQTVEAARLLDAKLRVAVPQFIDSLTPTTIAGIVILVATIAFVIWRIRYRFFNSDQFKATVCPVCGNEIHRVHRTVIDRILSKTLLPHARRYRCINQECNWSGLRRRRHHEHVQALPDAEVEPEQ